MDKAKRGWDPIGSWYAIVATLINPPAIANWMLTRFSNKITFVFSNVPGPKTPIDMGGADSKWFSFFVPGVGTAASGISIISHNDTVKIGCIAD
jgi:hypothetical protein